jgi:hypothetical protein
MPCFVKFKPSGFGLKWSLRIPGKMEKRIPTPAKQRGSKVLPIMDDRSAWVRVRISDLVKASVHAAQRYVRCWVNTRSERHAVKMTLLTP